MPSLPLFPLGAVLLPGSVLPLQLFEPRYLALAHHLLQRLGEDRRFGVVLIRHGHEVGADAVTSLADIGCEALVTDLALDPRGPVVHLLARGGRRFRLDHLTPTGDPWTTGEVIWLEEGEPPSDEALAEALGGYAAYARARGATEPLSAGPALAYRLTEALGVGVPDRQRVLEAPGPAAALRVATGLARRELALVDGLASRPFHAPPGASLN